MIVIYGFVNDITDSNTCLFSVAGFFLFLCFRKVCVRSVPVCLSQCVCQLLIVLRVIYGL